MQLERGVATRTAQPTLGHGDLPFAPRIILRQREAGALAQLEQSLLPARPIVDQPGADFGQALADVRLGRVDEHGARLAVAAFAVEPRLLPRLLQVVTGERLMGHRARELIGAHWQIRVDLDARLQVAVIPVVGGPRLAADHADGQLLAVGQGPSSSCLGAQLRCHPVDELG